MAGYIFSYCCSIIILLLGCVVYGNSLEYELYEGSQCTMERGESGVCKKLPECLSMLADTLAKRMKGDMSGRCGFDGFIEIICCPKVEAKIDGRPSEKACQEFPNKITSDINDDRLNGSPTTSLPDHTVEIVSYILNGDTADTGEFPYMAVLGYPNPDREASDPIIYNCGGSLISSKYILTAAHCLSNVNNLVPTWVRLGSESTRSTDAQMIPVKRTIPHPQYKRSKNYRDIGLVELQVQVRFSTRVQPICLQSKALQDSDVNSKTSFVTIGFGVPSDNEFRSDQLKKSANLNLVPATECDEHYQSFRNGRLPSGIDSTLICALDPNSSNRSDACQGDSGGPLLMISETVHTLLGVIAFGQTCGTPVPSVYTSVHSYIGWIESIVWPEKTTS